MLDVRITGYVTPLAEQPQASLTPVISVRNYADEDAVITGLIRIYRDSTGLLIYDSQLAVTELEHGTSANIAALTPFDPPAPADDDYFVKADLVATSYLPGPPLSVTFGAWHFDIKTPPMGEAPAGHGVTHELGGSDPVDISGLVGNPDPHAASHEDGGSDELSHGDLEGLTDDDHPQYKLRDEVFYELEFLGVALLYLTAPWYFAPTGGGGPSVTSLPGLPNHPGIQRLSCGTGVASGAQCRLDTPSLRLAGSERSSCILRPQTLLDNVTYFGFHDTAGIGQPTDGCYLSMRQIGGVDGVLEGKTASNSVRSTTGTTYTLITNTWYRTLIILNSDASRVDFYLYAEDGTLLWTDFLTTNIPTTAGRETGHGLIAVTSGTTAVALMDTDYINLWIPRTLVR